MIPKYQLTHNPRLRKLKINRSSIVDPKAAGKVKRLRLFSLELTYFVIFLRQHIQIALRLFNEIASISKHENSAGRKQIHRSIKAITLHVNQLIAVLIEHGHAINIC